MDIVIVTLLLLAGIFFLFIEIFLLPGISIAGVSAAISLIYANYYAFTNLGTTGGCISLITSTIGCILMLIWFMRSKTLDRLSLKKDINSSVASQNLANIKKGDTGFCITRLALIGNAEINGHIVEVKSADGFLNEKTPIVVKRIENGVIMVEKQNPIQ